MNGASATPNVFKQSYFASFIDVIGQSTLRSDVSMNSRLFVGSDSSMNGNLYVAKNLGIGINSTAFGPSGQIFALDVSGTTNFRGPVNPITLVDGSVLLTNTPPLDFSSNFGTNWVNANSAALTNYTSVKMSANGQYVIASYTTDILFYDVNTYETTYYGTNYRVATSNNFGNNWSIIRTYYFASTGGAFAYIAISANGQYQSYYASINNSNGSIYYSSNYGVTWTQSSIGFSSSQAQGISMNASGQYQTAITNNSYIYYSTNYGVNWTQSSSSTGNWTSIAINSSGQYQTATANVGNIYYSTNYGVNWTQASSLSGAWNSLAMSASGQYQSAAINNSYIYYSMNYGLNWTQSSSSTAGWTSVTMSANGQLQIAAASSSIVYVSKDYGITWSSITVSTGTVSNIAMSANGQYLVGTNATTLRLSTTAYFNVAISGSTLASTSTSTGALTVGGGVGIGGNLYVGGRTIISGNVGIGTTPNYSFDVNGVARFNISSGSGFFINNTLDKWNTGMWGSGAQGAGTQVTWNYNGGTGRTAFLCNGQGGTGGHEFYVINASYSSTTNPNYAPIYAASFNVSSDYRIKQNVIEISNTEYNNVFYNLRPVYYYNEHSKKNEFGFIAHEVNDIFPDLVDGEKDAVDEKDPTRMSLQTLNYTQIIPLCVKEIKDLKSQNQDLISRISSLEARLSAAGL
jgi:hypothetical protein